MMVMEAIGTERMPRGLVSTPPPPHKTLHYLRAHLQSKEGYTMDNYQFLQCCAAMAFPISGLQEHQRTIGDVVVAQGAHDVLLLAKGTTALTGSTSTLAPMSTNLVPSSAPGRPFASSSVYNVALGRVHHF